MLTTTKTTILILRRRVLIKLRQMAGILQPNKKMLPLMRSLRGKSPNKLVLQRTLRMKELHRMSQTRRAGMQALPKNKLNRKIQRVLRHTKLIVHHKIRILQKFRILNSKTLLQRQQVMLALASLPLSNRKIRMGLLLKLDLIKIMTTKRVMEQMLAASKASNKIPVVVRRLLNQSNKMTSRKVSLHLKIKDPRQKNSQRNLK